MNQRALVSRVSAARRISVAPAFMLATLLALGTLGFAGCKKKTAKKKPERVVPVKVEPAASRTLVSEVFLAGEIQADVEVRVFSLVPERIISLDFEEGDRVKKDQVLAVIKGGVLWQAVRQAQAGLNAAKTQEALAKIEVERTRKLYQTNTVAIAALQRVEAQHEVAQAQMKQMEAAVGQTYQNIANVTIRAPIDGVIGQRFLSKGDLAGPQLPLCTIIQTEEVRVRAMATELDVVHLKKDQPVTVSVPAFADQSWTGQVDYIAPVIDRMTRSAWVTVKVKNPGGLLRPGMFADMRVKTEERENVVMTLARAVVRRINEEGKVDYLVYLAENGVARERPVSIGKRQGDFMEISSGLRAGDPVVVLGNDQLRDATRIRVVDAEAASVARSPGSARPGSTPRRDREANPPPRGSPVENEEQAPAPGMTSPLPPRLGAAEPGLGMGAAMPAIPTPAATRPNP